jgi:hypothetical protein
MLSAGVAFCIWKERSTRLEAILGQYRVSVAEFKGAFVLVAQPVALPVGRLQAGAVVPKPSELFSWRGITIARTGPLAATLSAKAPCSGVAALLLLLPCIWFVQAGRVSVRKSRRSRAGRCIQCGYDLRASSDRCPECGRAHGCNLPQAG